MFAGLNETLERRFMRGYRKKYGQNANFADTNRVVDFTRVTLKGLPSMGNSPAIWATPNGNAVRLMKKTQNMNNVQLENVDRQIKLYSDWFSGAGFILGELLFTNDLDLGEPVITGITPLAAGTGGGTNLEIIGREFTGTTQVQLGGTDMANVTVVNDRKITCTTPAKTAGNHAVSVTNAYGTTNSTDQVTVS